MPIISFCTRMSQSPLKDVLLATNADATTVMDDIHHLFRLEYKVCNDSDLACSNVLCVLMYTHSFICVTYVDLLKELVLNVWMTANTRNDVPGLSGFNICNI